MMQQEKVKEGGVKLRMVQKENIKEGGVRVRMTMQ